MTDKSTLSLISGPPPEDEPGIGPLTLGGFIQHVVPKFSENEALILHEEGEEIRWTYRDLWDRSLEIAKSLIACGVTKGTRVGIMTTNRPEFLSATFGTALAGGVATTISTFSTASELNYLIEASACSVLIFEEQVLSKNFADILRNLEPAVKTCQPGTLQTTKFPYLKHLVSVGKSPTNGAIESLDDFVKRGASIPKEIVLARAENVAPSDPGVLFFSSGSTGKPKGVLSAHRGVTLQLWRWIGWFDLQDDVTARVWSANGFFWSGNFSMALGAALASGGSLVLQKTFNPEEALALIEQEKVTQALAWPHQWAQLEGASNWDEVDLSSLYYVDERTPLAKHKTVSTHWREPFAAYGNTETFTINTIFASGSTEEEIAGSHGRPLHGNTLKIVDPLSGEIVPIGERGEIAIKGPTLMLGYLGIPLDETLDDEGFLRTNDGGYVDETGRLYWEGRLNDIIKTGGANVSPVEIDNVLKTCPGVKMVQTVGVPHETLGELVVACVVPHEGSGVDEAAVRSFAKEELASYKIPRRVLFFSEDELQLTGSSKIKRTDLRDMAVKVLQAESA